MNITDHSSECPPEFSFIGDYASSARILLGINVLFCFIAIVGNVMASVAVFSTRRLNLSYHYFLSSLIVAELIVTLGSQPLLIALILAQLNSTCLPALQLTFRIVATFASYASHGTVTLIALDRCIYVCGKFNYTNTITSRKKMAIVIVWVMAGVLCGIKLGLDIKYLSLRFPLVVTSFLSYATVYHHISLQQKNRSQSSHENAAKQVQSGNETPTWPVACGIITILVLLLLRFLPTFLFTTLKLGKRFGLLYYTMATTGLIPSALYPVVYCLCYRNYRRSLKRVCSRFKHKETEETLSRDVVGQELQSSINSAAF
ncbi:uncharacterized protein LOC122952813 [Acropora millepora]|uniref:uncharacterized protein LOC122952813 n=1 Tax=Acropora millepora TaxID=45264 RepID=UPI001CF2312F|nr:uncharacterized protein LOC122952813 [Acropora millepora]